MAKKSERILLSHPSGTSESVEVGSDREQDLRAGGYFGADDTPPDPPEPEPEEEDAPAKGKAAKGKAAK